MLLKLFKGEEYLIFRIDDISVNTDIERLKYITSSIKESFPNAIIWLAVSMCVSDMNKFDGNKERIFPAIWNCYSDHKVFYKMDKIGIPDLSNVEYDKIVSHGYIHVDHRLLSKDLQEWNILSSCHILNAKEFVPPFNKYNKDTEDICKKDNISLIKWEDGWNHILYQKIKEKNYFHTHDFSDEKFMEKLKDV